MRSLSQTQVRVKKGYVPPEEQKAFRPATVAAPAVPGAVPGSDPSSNAPKPPMSKTAQKNAKRKAKRAEGGEGPGAPSPESASTSAVDVSDALAPAVANLFAAAGGGAAAAPTAEAPTTATKPAKARPASTPAPAPETSPPKEGGTSELEKKLRGLKKKLKAVEELEAKAEGGEELDANQKKKIATKEELKREIAQWEAYGDAENLERDIKKMGKKLRQIEDLEKRAEGGESLNEDQLGKISGKKTVLEELKKMEDLQASFAKCQL